MAKKKTTQVNITAVLTAELKKIRKTGFNGVRFHELHISMDPKTRIKDAISDGLTEAQGEEMCANYCTIMVNPDFDFMNDDHEESPYREVTTNIFGLYDDFAKHLKKLLGEDIVITEPRPSCEFEITRKGYKWPTC